MTYSKLIITSLIATLTTISTITYLKVYKNKNRRFKSNGLIDLIGNTPLIRINSLSDMLGIEILVSVEFI